MTHWTQDDAGQPGMKNHIITVPHSGTRSLQQYLTEEKFPGISSWHFAGNTPDIEKFRGIAHIPIRDPFDIAMSWEARGQADLKNNGQDSKPADLLVRALTEMVDYDRCHNAEELVYWPIDKVPRRRGKGPDFWGRRKARREEALQLVRPTAVRQWYRRSERAQEFYSQFFKKGFWWAQ